MESDHSNSHNRHDQQPVHIPSSSATGDIAAPSGSTATQRLSDRDQRSTRTSTRVRNAAKAWEASALAQAAAVPATNSNPSSSAPPRTRRTRASAAAGQQHPGSSSTGNTGVSTREKGKRKAADEEPAKNNKRSKRNTNTASGNASSGIVINEPPHDPKGKKRAAPISDSDDEFAGPSKRRRTTRSAAAAAAAANDTTASSSSGRRKIANESVESDIMPRRTRSSAKGKELAAVKTKLNTAGPSTIEDDGDVIMRDPSVHSSAASADDPDDVDPNEKEMAEEDGSGSDSEEDGEEDADEKLPDSTGLGGGMPPSTGSAGTGNPYDDAAAALFGADYRALGGYMLGLSSRLKVILNNIKQKDVTQRLMALQELSELLSMSTEDTLAGNFQVEAFVRELLKIMGGTGMPEEDEGEGDGDEDGDGEGGEGGAEGGGGAAQNAEQAGGDVPAFDEMDEDAALAAALAMSGGGMTDVDVEAQVLACRCLANLMEALPGCAHTVVYHGAVPVLCGKLVQIEYIDLAEQTLSTLEKISQEFPSSIVRAGGLSALLNYLDFFSTNVQRTALAAAANCCRSINAENAPMIRDVFPTIRNVLTYSDQRLVESACLCVIRILDSYRSKPEMIESIMDSSLVAAVNALLLPSGGSPLISASTYALLLRSLSNAAKGSPRATITLLEAGIVDTLYQILTGVLPPASEDGEEQGQGEAGQGLGGGLADMAVMQNLAHKPKDQVDEALGLICELMPPTPKDGVFDHKAYSEKALNKLLKAKRKAERATERTRAGQGEASASSMSPAPGPSDDGAGEAAPITGDSDEPMLPIPIKEESEPPVNRVELLRANSQVAGRFMRLTVPLLVDVYAASVALSLRTKAMASILKAVAFLNGDELRRILRYVPVASFIGSVVSSRDHHTLIACALTLVELLLTKLPDVYNASFRREGVLHEIDMLADRELKTKPPPKKEPAPAAPDLSPTDSTGSAPNAPPSLPFPVSLSKRTSHVIDTQDIVTLRARVLRAKNLTSGKEESGDSAFEQLSRLSRSLSESGASEASVRKTLRLIGNFFSAEDSISSFELMKSGLVDALLQFATAEDRKVPVARRRALLLEIFSAPLANAPSSSPFAVIVKRLQESLTRMETFEVITLSQNDDSKRGAASMLARQIRLRLVAEDGSDIPRAAANLVVSIHAIATFQALNDYLRPRITGGGSASRLSGVLAAFAAAAGLPPGAVRNAAAQLGVPPPPLSAGAGEGSSTAGTVATQGTRVSSKAPRAVGRRRSLRLRGEGGLGSAIEEAAAAPAAQPEPSSPGDEPIVEAERIDEDFIDDEFEGEILEDDLEQSPSAEKTVDLKVAADGTRVVAQTPEGTRVATPNIARETPSAGPSASSRISYAAALKTQPTDWHIQFTMDDVPIPLEMTVYGAIYQHEARKATGPVVHGTNFWSGMYTVKYKKVLGPASPEARNTDASPQALNPTLSSMPLDGAHSSIVSLLKVFYQLNVEWVDRNLPTGSGRSLSDSAFVNNKLTAKLTRQMEEPMIVASSCLPDWALELPQNFPFLFPFSTRYSFLQSTSFGYARLIQKWDSQHSRGNDNNSRRDDGFRFLGRPQRQKVRISRKHILESVVKVLELYGSSSSILEVEYFDEVGTGLGPTLEFYALSSREFARRDLDIWRDADASQRGAYVHHPTGLFPAPFDSDLRADNLKRRVTLFRVLGQFVAKSMLDSRIIDVHFNKAFMKMVHGEDVPLTLTSLRAVDPGLAKSLSQIQAFADAKAKILQDTSLDALTKKQAIMSLNINGVVLEDLALDFTVPGYDIELQKHGRITSVTAANVENYLSLSLDALLGKGVSQQVQAFREGFTQVFPVKDLQSFSAEELVMMFGNSDEDWSAETLIEAIKADHGFTSDSRAIRTLIDILSTLDVPTRRDFLQFITGSPKLPIGGFRGLSPPLTVVRKPHEPPLTADDYLPSVMTCVNYLKLPEYSSESVMRSKLRIAIKEGVGSFHLS